MEVDHLQHTSLKKHLSEFIHSSYTKEHPFVLFKGMEEDTIQCISGAHLGNVDASFLQLEKKGFVFSSFLKGENATRYFIPAEKHEIHSLEEEAENQNAEIGTTPFYFGSIEQQNTEEQAYIKQVEKAIEAIQKEAFKKVVLSKVKVEPRSKVDLLDAFLELAKTYSAAFVSLISLPKIGTWIGATPEVLINKTEDSFTTVSLAGTQPATVDIKEAVWRQKEIEEQALVNRYIVDCFKSIRLRNYKEIGPRTVRAGNLLHLKTVFKVNLKDHEESFPDLANQMLNLLHPTSAVCGVPMEPSLNFILKTEKHNRKFYSGYLGPVNINNSTNLYVNLRCAEIGEQWISFYSGAGITENSDPEREWKETEMKCDTLLKFL